MSMIYIYIYIKMERENNNNINNNIDRKKKDMYLENLSKSSHDERQLYNANV